MLPDTGNSRTHILMSAFHAMLENFVLKTWLDFNYHDPSMPVSTLLQNNSHIKHEGNVLLFTDWITGRILYVKNIKGPSVFVTFQDIIM